MVTYPKIKFPSELLSIKEGIPPNPQKPLEPIVPSKGSPLMDEPKFDEPKEPVHTSTSYGCFVFFLVGGIIIFIATASGEPNGGWFMFAIILGLIGLWGISNGSKEDRENSDRYIREKQEYPELLQKAKDNFERDSLTYKNHLQNIEEQYISEVDLYKNHRYPQYLIALELFEKEKKKMDDPFYIAKYRHEATEKYFKHKVTIPVRYDSRNEFKKGVSENFFLKHLINKFGNKVFTHFTIPNQLFHPPYMPDFTIYDHKVGYCIDVEIDEPYIGSNGKPIHFVENWHDFHRDNFFTKNGWIVIRFSEQQIIEYPLECCNLISKTINDICKEIALLDYDEDLFLPQMKQWNKEEAYEMAYKQLRNKYLHVELREKLNLESHENPDNYLTDTKKTVQKKVIDQSEKKFNDSDDLPF